MRTNTRPDIRRGKRVCLSQFQRPRVDVRAGPTPKWSIFMLEAASSEIGIRGTARLPNPAAISSKMSIRLWTKMAA
jgi:hypothetical protein